MSSSALNALRPKPFRGDVVAAGVVVLTTLVWVISVRFSSSWGPGVHLAYAVVAWVFVTTMAVLAPTEGDTPRAYQSVLYVAAVALVIDVVVQGSRVLGADEALSTPGNTTGVLTLVAAFALSFAIRRNSAVCTLLGALAAGIAVLAAVDWIFSPGGFATYRWFLLGMTFVAGFLAIGQRDRRLRHGVALIDVAGLAVLVIAASFLLDSVAGLILLGGESEAITGVAWGWELLIVATGFGLIAYSSVDRQPGPAYLGVLNLIAFATITSLGVTNGATLLGWPIALALAAAFLLVIGLRPTTPAPPPPDVDAPEAPPLPLR